MDIKIIDSHITLRELADIASSQFGNLVKAVIDVDREIMAIGGELHSDEEAVLLEQGSKQKDLWGINLYPKAPEESWIEFDSMINIRPSLNNRSRDVEDLTIREKIINTVEKLVQR